MDPFTVNGATDFMSDRPPDIAVPKPQQIVKQQYYDAHLGVHSTEYDFAVDFDFNYDIDVAFFTAPFSFAPPVFPSETTLPDLVPATGTRSIYSDASTSAPTTPESSQAVSFHDEFSGHWIKDPDPISSERINPASMTYSSWVGGPPASPNPMSIDVPLVNPDEHPFTPPGPHLSAHGHLPWQQSASGAAGSAHGLDWSSSGAPFATRHSTSLTQPSCDSPHSLCFGHAPMDMYMHQLTSTTTETASGTPVHPQDVAASSDQGTISPWLLHTSPPASWSLGSCFQGQEQPQLQHPYDAATAGAFGQGIGMQVTPYLHDHYQHASPQATSSGHSAMVPVVPDHPARSRTGSRGASQDPPKKEESEESKYICPLCLRPFDRSYNLRTHLDGIAHFGKRPYTCNVSGCPKQQRGYTRQRELDGHYARKHPELPPRERKSSATKGRSPRGGTRDDA
ncbi:hypothetical protein C8T65DRAFT_255677 [Cerioporus squamosus]|nr:hypothetical protein C8T65DRAFT_255677 [Cerioporus squamosus]